MLKLLAGTPEALVTVGLVEGPSPVAKSIVITCFAADAACWVGDAVARYLPNCDNLIVDLWTFDPFGIIGQSSIGPYKYPTSANFINAQNSGRIVTSEKIGKSSVPPVMVVIPRCDSNDKIACEVDSDGDGYVDCWDFLDEQVELLEFKEGRNSVEWGLGESG